MEEALVRTVVWEDLGRVEYAEALALQRRLALAKREDPDADDLLLLLEHPAVLTHGRAAGDGHIVEEPARLAERLVSVVEIDRGGDITYHGPGQLVGYPILDLGRYRRDLHWYLRSVEEVLIRTLGALGVAAARAEGLTGVWVGPAVATAGVVGETLPEEGALEAMRSGAIRKIASIGIHASRWITTHGFALNRTAEALEGFDWIVPCGLAGVTVTSLESEGVEIGTAALIGDIVSAFAQVFDADLRPAAESVASLPAR